jgi:hypothetical protein
MRQVILIIVSLLVLVNIFADGVMPQGTGTETNPYQINTLDNLLWLSTNSSSWSSHFIQTSDIDASETVNWNYGEGFSPIGNAANRFTGSYDGQDYIIHSLYIYRPFNYNIGLFGYLNNAMITNINTMDADVWGAMLVGAVSGYCSNTLITNCSSSGAVNGGGRLGGIIGECQSSSLQNCFSSIVNDYNVVNHVGGIVGYASDSSITQCSSDATLENANTVGGIVGESIDSFTCFCNFTGYIIGICTVGGIAGSNNNSTISNCTNSGTLTTNPSNQIQSKGLGGIVGTNRGNIYNCSNYGEINGFAWVGGIVGYMADDSNVRDCTSTGNVNGSASGVGGIIGYCREDNTDNSFYNYEQVLINGEHSLSIGALDNDMYQDWVDNGYEDLDINDYLLEEQYRYILNSFDDLKYLIAFNRRRFRLANDIDLVNAPEFHIPSFRGTFDGNGYTISNLNFTQSWLYGGGFFGLVSNSTITNLTISNVNLSGHQFTGGLCGYLTNSTISNCSSTGSVTASSQAGGLIGVGVDSSVYNSYSRVDMVGPGLNLVGGFAGNLSESYIEKCYSTGSLPENASNGGLVGYFYSGGNDESIVSNCFWDVESSGVSISAGGTGLTTLEMQTLSNYTDAGWDFSETGNWAIDGVTNDGYPFLVYESIVDNDDEIASEQSSIATLIGNYPNPFNPETTIKFSISKNSNVDLSIYNIKGQRVRTLANQQYPVGEHSLVWNGDDDPGRSVGSGVYFYKLSVDGQVVSIKKCVLMK